MSARYCICGEPEFFHGSEGIGSTGSSCVAFLDAAAPVTLETFAAWGKRIGAKVYRSPAQAALPEVVRVIEGPLVLSLSGEGRLYLFSGGVGVPFPGVNALGDLVTLWRLLGGAA